MKVLRRAMMLSGPSQRWSRLMSPPKAAPKNVPDRVAVKRVLISVSDKTGLVERARSWRRQALIWSPPAARRRR
jgi:hypothetical protein